MLIKPSHIGPNSQHPARRIVKDMLGLDELIVESKTIGTQMVYNLSPRNFSRSGMLLSSCRYKRVPFKINTLIEMTIDTRGVLFSSPIQVLGKVVRLEDGQGPEGSSDAHTRFGVQILQMDSDAMVQWEDQLAHLEAVAEKALNPA